VNGATGVLARRVVAALLAEGHAVTGLGRSGVVSARQARHASGGDGSVRCGGTAAAVAEHDAVINLATAVPAGNHRFLPGAWRAMARVRRDGSRLLANARDRSGGGTRREVSCRR
jgi:nucleoside-diphosphate-sugar epimerase